MGKLVNVLGKRMKCEVFPCKQNAEFTIGREGHKALNFNVCREDARQIMEDLIVIFAENDNGVADIPETQAEPEPVNLAGKEITAIYTDETAGNPETIEADSTPTSEEIPEGEEEPNNDGNDAPQNQDEPTDGEETALPDAETVFSEEVAPEEPVEAKTTGEFYSCKYCGATFPKTPAGKTALMTHTKACAKLAKQAQV